MNPTKEARDIIRELASKPINLSDQHTLYLIQKLNSIADTTGRVYFKENTDSGYYSAKDVAELFDVSNQTVYKWINEDKIKYMEDKSPGKQQRKGYLIPKEQFNHAEQIAEIDPSFFPRREEEKEEIPEKTSSDSPKLPTGSDRKRSKSQIKKMLKKKPD